MAVQPPDDTWVEMQAEFWPATTVTPDGVHYTADPQTGRVWVRHYHVPALVQHRLTPMTVSHPDVYAVVADGIGNARHDIHERIAAAAQAVNRQAAKEAARQQPAPTPQAPAPEPAPAQ
jgi:hypothetical protein